MSPSTFSALLAATDEEVMVPLLQEPLAQRWGLDSPIVDFRAARVTPKGGKRFLIQYRFSSRTANSDRLRAYILYGKQWGPEDGEPRLSGIAKNETLIFPDLRLEVPLFPFDSKLLVLRDLIMRDGLGRFLAQHRQALGLPLPLAKVAVPEILGYRLEQRCVLRVSFCLTENGKTSLKRELVLKLCRADQANRQARLLKILSEHGFDFETPDRLTVPKLLFSDSTSGTLFLESIRAESLHNLIGQADFLPGCRAAALILEKLHASSIPMKETYSVTDELELLFRLTREIGELFPTGVNGSMEWTQRLEDLFKRLTATRPSADYALVPIHRDFYDKQVLYSSNRTTVVDWDTLVAGDPALDFGNFLAHLYLRKLQHPQQASMIQSGCDLFLTTYEIPNEAFRVRAGWWQAASLLRIACLYMLRPRWRSLAPALAEASDQCLNEIEK